MRNISIAINILSLLTLGIMLANGSRQIYTAGVLISVLLVTVAIFNLVFYLSNEPQFKVRMENKCPNCEAPSGCLHIIGCNVERCPECGGQSIKCVCKEVEKVFDETQDDRFFFFITHVPVSRKRLEWTGEWPGALECREFGWYSKLVNGVGLVQCDKNDNGASEDLTRLTNQGVWNAEKGRYQLPEET